MYRNAKLILKKRNKTIIVSIGGIIYEKCSCKVTRNKNK